MAANLMEMADGLRVGIQQAAFQAGQAMFGAERPDQGLGAAQVRPGHAGKEVVLDLVVKPPRTTSTIGPPRTLREVSTWRRRKSNSSCSLKIGIPLWLGTKAHPRYRPNRHCCTAMHTTARSGDRTSTTAVT